jgi:hypothetical protein
MRTHCPSTTSPGSAWTGDIIIRKRRRVAANMWGLRVPMSILRNKTPRRPGSLLDEEAELPGCLRARYFKPFYSRGVNAKKTKCCEHGWAGPAFKLVL